jgi:hypothetical protein
MCSKDDRRVENAQWSRLSDGNNTQRSMEMDSFEVEENDTLCWTIQKWNKDLAENERDKTVSNSTELNQM